VGVVRVAVFGVVRVLDGIGAAMRAAAASSVWSFRLRAVFCRVRLRLTVGSVGGGRGGSEGRKKA
jgi:hypothetical protein